MNQKKIVQWDGDFEEYASYQPCALKCFEKKMCAGSWADVFYDIILMLYKRDSAAFKKMNARCDFGDMFSVMNIPQKGTRGLPNDCPASYLITNLPPDLILSHIAKCMRWFGLNGGDIQIACIPAVQKPGQIAPSVLEQIRKNAAEEEKFRRRSIRNSDNSDALACARRASAQSCKMFNPNPRIQNEFEKLNARRERAGRQSYSLQSLRHCDGAARAQGLSAHNPPKDAECASGGYLPQNATKNLQYIEWQTAAFNRYQNAIPEFISFSGQIIPVQSWSALFQKLCETLASIDAKRLVRAFKAPALIDWIPPKKPYCRMTKPVFVESCRLWVETDRSPADILNAIMSLTLHFAIDVRDISIAYAFS